MAVGQPDILYEIAEASGTTVAQRGTHTSGGTVTQGTEGTHWSRNANSNPELSYLETEVAGGGSSNMTYVATAGTGPGTTLETINCAVKFRVDALDTVLGESHIVNGGNDTFRIRALPPAGAGNFDLEVAFRNSFTLNLAETYSALSFGVDYILACSVDVTTATAILGRFKLGHTPVRGRVQDWTGGPLLQSLWPWLGRFADFTDHGGMAGRWYWFAYQRGGTPWSAADLNDIIDDPATIGNWSASAVTLEQEGFRFRNDDGSESTATWLAAQDAHLTQPLATNTRLRVLVNATAADPNAAPYQLEYKKSTDSTYLKALPAAVIPSVRAIGPLASDTVGITPEMPVHEKDDILLCVCESPGGEAVSLTTTNGFAQITGSPQNTGAGTAGTRLTVFWKRAASGEELAPVIADPGDHVMAFIVAVKDCIESGDPWNATSGNVKGTASTSMSWDAVTTSIANCLIVLLASRDNDLAAAAWSAQSNANLGSLTEHFDSGAIDGNGGGLCLTSGTKAAAGDTGATTVTVTSSVNAFLTIALKPRNSAIALALSANIAASGAATTAQLAAPATKTTADFTAGRIQDDENPTDLIDIPSVDYTEAEWCLQAGGIAVNSEIYQFRVTRAGVLLDTYTLTPQWTIGTPGAGGVLVRTLSLMGGGMQSLDGGLRN